MNKRLACFIHAFLFFTLTTFLLSSCEPSVVTRTKVYFGTTCTLSIKTNHIDKYFKILEDLDKKFSYRDENSEIAKINQNAGKNEVEVSPDVYELIKRSITYSKETEGAFNPLLLPLVGLWGWDTGDVRVPNDDDIKDALELISIDDVALSDDHHTVFLKKEGMGLDLGGIVKGHASNLLVEAMREDGITEGIINLGGNVYVFGNKDYSVAIQKPYANRGVHDINVNVRNKSVVTSGAYERGREINGVYYHHIINPFTGYPAQEIYKSVTVIDADSELCDVWATAIFVLGDKEKLSKFNKDVKIITQ